jgi:hypothetical protein
VDSVPPPPSFRQRKLRPWYLVATMGLVWVIGLYGLTSACNTVGYLREGSMPDVAQVVREVEHDRSEIYKVHEAAYLRAISEHHHITFPLQVAKLLLSGLLVIASGLAMRGRKGARALALQVLAANAILALIDYVLTRSIRSAWIEAVAQTGEMLPMLPVAPGAPSDEALWTWTTRRTLLWWSARIWFVLDQGALVLAALALTRAKTKVFFDAVARATEQAEEP